MTACVETRLSTTTTLAIKRLKFLTLQVLKSHFCELASSSGDEEAVTTVTTATLKFFASLSDAEMPLLSD